MCDRTKRQARHALMQATTNTKGKKLSLHAIVALSAAVKPSKPPSPTFSRTKKHR